MLLSVRRVLRRPRHRKHQKLDKLSFPGSQGNYIVLLFYPANFTLAAQQNLLNLSDSIQEFESRNIRILACSRESKISTMSWMNEKRIHGGIANIEFPIICDLRGDICRNFCAIQDSGSSNSGFPIPLIYILDPLHTVRYAAVHQESVSLSVQELLRILRIIQEMDLKGEEGITGTYCEYSYTGTYCEYSNKTSFRSTTRTDTIMKYFDSATNEPKEEEYFGLSESSTQTESVQSIEKASQSETARITFSDREIESETPAAVSSTLGAGSFKHCSEIQTEFRENQSLEDSKHFMNDRQQSSINGCAANSSNSSLDSIACSASHIVTAILNDILNGIANDNPKTFTNEENEVIENSEEESTPKPSVSFLMSKPVLWQKITRRPFSCVNSEEKPELSLESIILADISKELVIPSISPDDNSKESQKSEDLQKEIVFPASKLLSSEAISNSDESTLSRSKVAKASSRVDRSATPSTKKNTFCPTS